MNKLELKKYVCKNGKKCLVLEHTFEFDNEVYTKKYFIFENNPIMLKKLIETYDKMQCDEMKYAEFKSEVNK